MSNSQIISDYMRAVFVERDLGRPNPSLARRRPSTTRACPNGHDAVRGFITNAPKDLTYEQGQRDVPRYLIQRHMNQKLKGTRFLFDRDQGGIALDRQRCLD